jgi:cation diffusion facilitator family transporter
MSDAKLKRNTLIGLISGIVLAGVKLAAGIFGHSSALVADAVESLADSVGSIIVFQGLRMASRPADERHPYGYGKAEALAALVVGMLLFLAAGGIVYRAFQEILTPHSAPEVWTLWVLIAVIVIKEWMFRLIREGAEESDSDAARADAWHHRSDAITSGAALIGVTIAIYGPSKFGISQLVLADEAAAMIASGLIVFTAIGIMRDPMSELLDRRQHRIEEDVRRFGSEIAGVIAIEKLFARKSGRVYHIDMHLHVAPTMSVYEAHALGGRVKAHVRAKLPNVGGVLIHIEPAVNDVTSNPESALGSSH